MSICWPKLWTRMAIWLCAEVALTFLGLDSLADYSEFVFQGCYDVSSSDGHPVTLVTL